MAPDAGLQIVAVGEAPPVTVGAGYSMVCVELDTPRTDMSAGHVICGGVVVGGGVGPGGPPDPEPHPAHVSAAIAMATHRVSCLVSMRGFYLNRSVSSGDCETVVRITEKNVSASAW